MKLFTISYNDKVVTSKEAGNKIEQFKSISFDLDLDTDQQKLEEFFRSHVYSTNKFIGKGSRGQKLEGDYEGYAANTNYVGMYGIAIDYDDGDYTFEQAHEAFSNYVHIIHSSSSNMLDVPRHKGIQPRFRVILPFEISDEQPYLYENLVDGELVYSLLKERYPNADPSVFSVGRKFFPFTGDIKRYEFKLHIPDKPAPGSKSIFYTIGFEELDAHKIVLEAKTVSKKKGKTDRINRTDVVILDNRSTKKRISDITVSGTKVFCLFCDDLDSDGASAQINLDKHGNYNMFCHHCRKTYWEQDLNWKQEAEPNLFFDEGIGHIGKFNPVTGQVKYFKNEKDWLSFTTEQEMPKDIYTKLPRANKTVDLTRPFGMHSDKHGNKLFNIFYPSKYLEDFEVVQKRIEEKKQKPLNLTGLPTHTPIIWRVLKNVFQADSDIKIFINWLAYIIQARKQSTIAWIIITAPGAGKGVIGELILRPIFGKHAVLSDNGNAIGAQFNIEDAGCWIKYYNEVFTKANFGENLARREWLKDRIGTNEILLEAKGIDKIKIRNFVNYLLYSNIEHAFLLEEGDRRFNVVNTLKLSQKLSETDWWKELGGTSEAFEKAIEKEIPAFAEFIQNVEWDWTAANLPTETPARHRLIEYSAEDVDFVIKKLNIGEVDYFELETIYPSSTGLMGVDPNSDIRAEITEFVEKYHCIPSKYAVQVFGHHLRMTSRTNIKRKLEQRGMVIGKQMWHKESNRNVRVYIHETQVAANKLEASDLLD